MMASPLGFKSLGPWKASSEVAHGQGDTRPTTLAGHLREFFLNTCRKLSCGVWWKKEDVL